MDEQTLSLIADLVCGDSEEYPVYRSGSDLTRFFQRVGFSNFVHDGSTRKWWTLGVLRQLTERNLNAVILRLANPKEYGENQERLRKALKNLNGILMIEGLKVELSGVTPRLKQITPQFAEIEEKEELKPLPPPDFLNLKLEPGLGEILSGRRNEIQKCVDAGAYLAATIQMGALLEGIFLSVLQKYSREANTSTKAPKDSKTGEVKHFDDWSLSNMIDVAHDMGWIGLDVKKFSHSLRKFRNLIHPYQQMILMTYPDKDTCEISWLVVQAAINDIAKKLK